MAFGIWIRIWIGVCLASATQLVFVCLLSHLFCCCGDGGGDGALHYYTTLHRNHIVGPATIQFFSVEDNWNKLAPTNDYVFTCEATTATTATVVNSHVVLANVPSALHVVKSDISVHIADEVNEEFGPEGQGGGEGSSVDITLTATHPALYVAC